MDYFIAAVVSVRGFRVLTKNRSSVQWGVIVDREEGPLCFFIKCEAYELFFTIVLLVKIIIGF